MPQGISLSILVAVHLQVSNDDLMPELQRARDRIVNKNIAEEL